MAVTLMVPEKTLDAVVTHQFDMANVAITKQQSVELSGFGKFVFYRKKALKQMEKLRMQQEFYNEELKKELSQQERRSIGIRLHNVEVSIMALKSKLHED